MHITYSIRTINYWTPHRLGHFCTFSTSKILTYYASSYTEV